jgi:hypothetical protein
VQSALPRAENENLILCTARWRDKITVQEEDMDESMRAGKRGVSGRSVRGGQSDVRTRSWLADTDTNWRTLRRDAAAAYHASRVPFLLIKIHCFDIQI